MANRNSKENISDILGVLEEMRNAGIIEKYAIGGAFAAILHYEPISTIDLDIFFFLREKNDSPILGLNAIYDFAKQKGFHLTTNSSTFTAGSSNLSKRATAHYGRKQLKMQTR